MFRIQDLDMFRIQDQDMFRIQDLDIFRKQNQLFRTQARRICIEYKILKK